MKIDQVMKDVRAARSDLKSLEKRISRLSKTLSRLVRENERLQKKQEKKPGWVFGPRIDLKEPLEQVNVYDILPLYDSLDKSAKKTYTRLINCLACDNILSVKDLVGKKTVRDFMEPRPVVSSTGGTIFFPTRFGIACAKMLQASMSYHHLRFVMKPK